MTLAVLSGKGGTGKTLLSVNLAALRSDTLYVDCDVEAPNGRLFLKPTGITVSHVQVKMPTINPEACIGCRSCVAFCQFNALAYVGKKVKVFEDICHSCGGCSLVCPTKAITEYERTIGTLEAGISEDIFVMTGSMNIGEASGVPIIESLIKEASRHQGPVVVDCPPGSACVVMESIKGADHCLLVAEPTIFGRHNVSMVHELVKKMGKSSSLVINKSYGDDTLLTDYCTENQIPIVGRIPYDEELAFMGSKGEVAVRKDARFKKLFEQIHQNLEEVMHEKITDSKW